MIPLVKWTNYAPKLFRNKSKGSGISSMQWRVNNVFVWTVEKNNNGCWRSRMFVFLRRILNIFLITQTPVSCKILLQINNINCFLFNVMRIIHIFWKFIYTYKDWCRSMRPLRDPSLKDSTNLFTSSSMSQKIII